MKKKTYILWFIVMAVIITTGFFAVKKVSAPVEKIQPTTGNTQQAIDNNQAQIPSLPVEPDKQKVVSLTVDPLPDALSRITKKPFGILINSKTSPVQPERFAGYHNAVDLETTPAEQNVDVSVKALCDGKLLSARTASGYGGVAVQSCTLDGQVVTVVYGHIRLSSLKNKAGDQLQAGDFLADLGNGFSSETDGERKHLHLGIHKGNAVNIAGYVQSKSGLSAWLDPQKFLD